MDTAFGVSRARNTYRVRPWLAEIEQTRKIRNGFDLVLRWTLKTRCFSAVIAISFIAHHPSSTGEQKAKIFDWSVQSQ